MMYLQYRGSSCNTLCYGTNLIRVPTGCLVGHVADSEMRESQKRSGKSTDTVAQLCTHEEEDEEDEH